MLSLRSFQRTEFLPVVNQQESWDKDYLNLEMRLLTFAEADVSELKETVRILQSIAFEYKPRLDNIRLEFGPRVQHRLCKLKKKYSMDSFFYIELVIMWYKLSGVSVRPDFLIGQSRQSKSLLDKRQCKFLKHRICRLDGKLCLITKSTTIWPMNSA